jgi:hypothetical protein
MSVTPLSALTLGIVQPLAGGAQTQGMAHSKVY